MLLWEEMALPWLIEWLILTACQPVKSYFMPWSLKLCSLYIYIYIFTLHLTFLHTVTWYQVFLSNTNNLFTCPVGWGCTIHGLHLCREVKPSTMSVLDMTLNFLMEPHVPLMLELWEIQSTTSLPTLPGPLWLGVLAPDRVLSMGQIELNCTLNWIAWNRTVLTFKLRIYPKLNCLKWNCFCMLNWIVPNRTVFDICV